MPEELAKSVLDASHSEAISDKSCNDFPSDQFARPAATVPQAGAAAPRHELRLSYRHAPAPRPKTSTRFRSHIWTGGSRITVP